ncbi:hypothetical protein TNCV_4082871 [Trichonephila clavipes]|nr:hypothetical protein TNCV_4082871 [Trichonephila clavipes]
MKTRPESLCLANFDSLLKELAPFLVVPMADVRSDLVRWHRPAAALFELPGDSTTCLELVLLPKNHFQCPGVTIEPLPLETEALSLPTIFYLKEYLLDYEKAFSHCK